MDVVGDSTAEPQVRRLLFGDGKHVHGSGRAGDRVECVVNGMLGIVKHRTVACHFDAFAVGEGFGFRMGGHDVWHVHRETPDADAAQHGQMAAEAEFGAQIAAECADVGAGRAGHGHVEFHDWLHVRFVLPVGFGMPGFLRGDFDGIGKR